jgi:hypothetical protein
MATVLARKRDGVYVKALNRTEDYLHWEPTRELDEAQRVSEEEAHAMCELDFFGVPYSVGGYNGRQVDPEFFRVTVLE